MANEREMRHSLTTLIEHMGVDEYVDAILGAARLRLKTVAADLDIEIIAQTLTGVQSLDEETLSRIRICERLRASSAYGFTNSGVRTES